MAANTETTIIRLVKNCIVGPKIKRKYEELFYSFFGMRLCLALFGIWNWTVTSKLFDLIYGLLNSPVWYLNNKRMNSMIVRTSYVDFIIVLLYTENNWPGHRLGTNSCLLPWLPRLPKLRLPCRFHVVIITLAASSKISEMVDFLDQRLWSAIHSASRKIRPEPRCEFLIGFFWRSKFRNPKSRNP